jgi:hypothetical protein
LLNEYTYANSHLEERKFKSEYFDKNIGNLSYSIVENYRRELNFSWVSWQLLDQIRQKKFSIKTLKKEFIIELAFSIFPNQENIFHYLIENFEELQNFLAVINEETTVIGNVGKVSP